MYGGRTAPYLVLTHKHWCPGCRRDVEVEEIIINDDDDPVHLGCGFILDEQGHIIPEASGRMEGADLAVLDGAPGAEATWLAEQRRLLASLPGGIKDIASGDFPSPWPGAGREIALSLLDQATMVAKASAAPALAAIEASACQSELPGAEVGKRRRGDRRDQDCGEASHEMKFDVTLQNWFDHEYNVQAAFEEAHEKARRRDGLLNARELSAVAVTPERKDLYQRFRAGDKTVREEDFPIRYTMQMLAEKEVAAVASADGLEGDELEEAPGTPRDETNIMVRDFT